MSSTPLFEKLPMGSEIRKMYEEDRSYRELAVSPKSAPYMGLVELMDETFKAESPVWTRMTKTYPEETLQLIDTGDCTILDWHHGANRFECDLDMYKIHLETATQRLTDWNKRVKRVGYTARSRSMRLEYDGFPKVLDVLRPLMYAQRCEGRPRPSLVLAGGALETELMEKDKAVSDYDFFLVVPESVGDRETAARDLLHDALLAVTNMYPRNQSLLHPIKMEVQAHVTTVTVGFGVGAGGLKLQFIHRAYYTPAQVVHGFDLPSCAFLYDGASMWATERALHAWSTRLNMVDTERQSTSFEHRLLRKSMNRGIHPLLFCKPEETRVNDLDASVTERGIRRLLALRMENLYHQTTIVAEAAKDPRGRMKKKRTAADSKVSKPEEISSAQKREVETWMEATFTRFMNLDPFHALQWARHLHGPNTWKELEQSGYMVHARHNVPTDDSQETAAETEAETAPTPAPVNGRWDKRTSAKFRGFLLMNRDAETIRLSEAVQSVPFVLENAGTQLSGSFSPLHSQWYSFKGAERTPRVLPTPDCPEAGKNLRTGVRAILSAPFDEWTMNKVWCLSVNEMKAVAWLRFRHLFACPSPICLLQKTPPHEHLSARWRNYIPELLFDFKMDYTNNNTFERTSRYMWRQLLMFVAQRMILQNANHECSICLEQKLSEAGRTYTLKQKCCNAYFHPACIREAARTSSQCPHCRRCAVIFN